MRCLRKLLFVAAVFSGKTLGTATVIVSETPDPIYMTTTILIYDKTVTPTDSIATSTSLSPTPSPHHALYPPHPAAHVPLPGLIPKPEPANEEFSSVPQLTTFITHTIPQETTTDSSSSLTVTATSTPSAAPALEQSDTSPSPSSNGPSIGAIVGMCVGGTIVVIGVVLYTMSDETFVKDYAGRYPPCFILLGCILCGIPLSLYRLVNQRAARGKSRKKQAEPLESLRVDVEGETTLEGLRDDVQRETTPVELDATNEVIGELSAPETRPYHSHPPPMVPVARELDGSSTLSLHGPPSTSRQPAELPTSIDEGASSLPPPPYEDLEIQTNGRAPVFSWAAPESAYRPEKRDS